MALKIKPEHVTHMREKIQEVLEKYPELPALYEAGQFHRSGSVKDLQKRFCFDLANMAGLTKFFCTEIYSYANDDHIYSALKTICPKVKRKY